MSDGARCHYCHKNRCECADAVQAMNEFDQMEHHRDELRKSGKPNCPHCNGDLSHWEHPQAIVVIQTYAEEIRKLKTEIFETVTNLGVLAGRIAELCCPNSGSHCAFRSCEECGWMPTNQKYLENEKP